jgi:hypothetical protein
MFALVERSTVDRAQSEGGKISLSLDLIQNPGHAHLNIIFADKIICAIHNAGGVFGEPIIFGKSECISRADPALRPAHQLKHLHVFGPGAGLDLCTDYPTLTDQSGVRILRLLASSGNCLAPV